MSLEPHPVAPLPSSQIGPAQSTCPNGLPFTTKFCKKRAAVMDPPKRVPKFFKSAKGDSSCSAYSWAMGIRQVLSPVALEAASNSAAKASSSVQTPAICLPSDTMQAPVKVENSTIFSACTSLSA